MIEIEEKLKLVVDASIYRAITDTNYRIDGHKVILMTNNVRQNLTPMNSNSENPYYLTENVDKDGNIVVSCINCYENHKIDISVDLKFDKNGDYIPYSKTDKRSSHSHKWVEDASGKMGRKAHSKKNTLPIDPEFNGLIGKIVKFNKAKHKWTI